MKESKSRLAVFLLSLGTVLGALLLQPSAAPAGGGSCSVIANPCDPTFDTGQIDCSTAYPPVGTPPLDDGKAGFANFGGPQVSPMLRLRAKGTPWRGHLFVLNGLNHEVSVLDHRTLERVATIPVGLDPSAIAQTKDGSRILVSNWTSDTVSVIDTASLRVVATVEHRDADGRPLLAEPMGIAVRGNDKAYVASSATNQIAVVDLATLQVVHRIDVPARDPRALALDRRGRFLAVAGFAAGNRTEPTFDVFDASLTGIGDADQPITESCLGLLTAKPDLFDPSTSGYMDPSDPDFRDAFNCLVGGRINAFFSATELEPLAVNPRIPDHDVVIVDTATDRVVATSGALPEDPGTLNYDVAFDRAGKRLAVANTHARNDVEFADRPWQNRVTFLEIDRGDGSLTWAGSFDLDVAPGQSGPTPADRATTPTAAVALTSRIWAIAAAGSDRVLVVGGDGVVQQRLDVGFVPRGLVRENGRRVYVLNSAGFTVQRWDVKRGELLAEGSIGDNPLPMEERHGLRLFHGDQFSVNRSFSCASCHPDGDTDHLVWLLDCTDGLRATMTLRQIEKTLPFHWSGDKCNGKKIMEDGVANLFGQGAAPSACDVDLTWQYIESLRQPPPGRRASDDRLSPDATLGLVAVNRARYKGIADFALPCNGRPEDPIAWPRLLAAAGDPSGDVVRFDRSTLRLQGADTRFTVGLDHESCGVAGCHAQPFSGRGTLLGFELGGFCPNQPEPIEAVSFLGAHDRLLTEDDGRGALYDFLLALQRYRDDVGASDPVLDAWGVPRWSSGLKGFLATFFRHAELEYEIPGTQGFTLADRIERFVQEQATGPSAAVGRQATVTPSDVPVAALSLLMDAADQAKIRLIASGSAAGTDVELLYDPVAETFVGAGVPGGSISLSALLASLAGADAVTFTAGLPKPAPAPFSVARGAQPFLFSVTRSSGFPVACDEAYPEQIADFTAGETMVPLTIYAVELGSAPAAVFVNGMRMPGAPSFVAAATYAWTLPAVPAGADTLVFQIQSEGGLLSNEIAALVVEGPPEPLPAAVAPTSPARGSLDPILDPAPRR